MFKEIKIIVWTAFICWMAFFLFSLNQAEAQTPTAAAFSEPSAQAVVTKLKLYKSYLCQFVDDQASGSPAVSGCNNSNVPMPSGTTVTTAEMKTLFLQETNDLCGAGVEPSFKISVTSQAATECWKAADNILSDNSYARHTNCYIGKHTSGSALYCLAKSFQEDTSDAEKIWTDIKSRGEQGKNEGVLRDFARALCHDVNKETVHHDLFYGLTSEHTSSCDKTATTMIDDSKGQIPGNDDQVKAYEAGLSLKICTAYEGDSSKDPHMWSASRLACFQKANYLYGGVGRSNKPNGCTDDQLDQRVPDDFRSTTFILSSHRAEFLAQFRGGALCYQQLFKNEADASTADSTADTAAIAHQAATLDKLGYHGDH